MPDGEVAGRRQWVTCQSPVLRSYGFLRPQAPNRFVPLKLNGDVDPADIRFAELGYAREARTSYADVFDTRTRDLVGADVRVQVGMPTPLRGAARLLDHARVRGGIARGRSTDRVRDLLDLHAALA